MRVLHSATEAFPYVKVGGLSDVLGALPGALRQRGVDARLLLPGFPSVLEAATPLVECRKFAGGLPGAADARLLRGDTARGVPLYVLDAPGLFARSREPYADFGDSDVCAAALSRAAFEIAKSGDGDSFVPDILHCHDWQTGLTAAYTRLEGLSTPTIVTIHNLAYQGLYGPDRLDALWLPSRSFTPDGSEFWGKINLLKTGLVYATRITTVSPNYAREIQTAEHGHGLDGVLRARAAELSGILNGIDPTVWDPSRAPHLAAPFDLSRLGRRPANKAALQAELGLEREPSAPLFGVVSRLNTMKGLDLLAENLPHLVGLGAQLVVLGRGDPVLEQAFERATREHPGRVARSTAQDEPLAHRIFAGSDFVVVPSRSEPCGLVQMYAMRYGALPIARYTGGLADTVSDETVGPGATGFTFDPPSGYALGNAITRACHLYRVAPARLRELQTTGMQRDFSWGASADRYVAIYRDLTRAGR